MKNNTFLKYEINTPEEYQYDQSQMNLGQVFNDFTMPSSNSFSDIKPNTAAAVKPEVEEIASEAEDIKDNTTTDSVVETITPENLSGKGFDNFNAYYDQVLAENPDAAKYREFLTRIAKAESNFDNYIQNRAGAPAYGYFQFMQDGKGWNNIKTYAGTDIETFRNNPKLQIQAAIKLAQAFEKGLSKKDLELAKKQGYSINALLAGAWLGGNGNVRRFLEGQGDASDKHWDKKGNKGTSVGDRMKQFNFKSGGKLHKYI